ASLALLGAAFRVSARRVSVTALSLVLALAWIPFPVPAAALVWTAHARTWLWIVIAAALVAPARRWLAPMPIQRAAANPRVAPWLAASLAACVFLLAAWQVSPRLPGGDEPHYLII